MATSKSSLIYIPDISGFTKFVTETEIDHSAHIIEELLEIIMDANQIGMEVSEIEGDAVLFYRFGEPPTAVGLVQQSKEMFVKFHEHLMLYERDRVCQCGACSTAQELTLKMVAHYGELSHVKVREHSKLLGEDMIIAHRLLKNEINADEYLLLSGKYLNSIPTDLKLGGQGWIDLVKGNSSYSEIGSVDYQYTILTPLRDILKEPPPRAQPLRAKKPIVIQGIIKAPIKFLHEVISNADYKPLLGAIEVSQDKSVVPRVGSSHVCILPNTKLHFETIDSILSEDHMEFSEKAENFPLVNSGNIVNLLDKIDDNSTKLTIEFHHFPVSFVEKVKYALLRPLLWLGFRKGFKGLMVFAENHKA
jgi:hypothetical protein